MMQAHMVAQRATQRQHSMPNAEITALLMAAFGNSAHPLASWYGELLADNAALRAFVAANAPKIRKKLRQARDPEAERDLRCELAVAAALADRRSPLQYEPLAAANKRGPDFLLRHKGHTDVYVEVSRLRIARDPEAAQTNRLAALLCGKLGQLAPAAANLLVVISDVGPVTAADLAALLAGLRRRADARDDAFFAFRGLDGARAFLQTVPRLSAALVTAPSIASDTFLPHTQARHALPADLARSAAAWALGERVGHA